MSLLDLQVKIIDFSLVTYAGCIQSFSPLNIHHSKLTLINQPPMHKTQSLPYIFSQYGITTLYNMEKKKICHYFSFITKHFVVQTLSLFLSGFEFGVQIFKVNFLFWASISAIHSCRIIWGTDGETKMRSQWTQRTHCIASEY